MAVNNILILVASCFALVACGEEHKITMADCKELYPNGAKTREELAGMLSCVSDARKTEYHSDRSFMESIESESKQEWANDDPNRSSVGKMVAGESVDEAIRNALRSECVDGVGNKLPSELEISSSVRVDRGHPKPRITCMLIKNSHFAGTVTVDMRENKDGDWTPHLFAIRHH